MKKPKIRSLKEHWARIRLKRIDRESEEEHIHKISMIFIKAGIILLANIVLLRVMWGF